MNEVTAFVSVGSNIDPLKHIPQALTLLQQRERVIATSTFYQTEPLGHPDQPAFVNGVWAIRTSTDPLALQDLLHQIETQMGRVRTIDKYTPRVIDLDLILYGQKQCHTPKLTLPHPDLHRPFVREPIHELITALDLEDFHDQQPKNPPSPQDIGQPLPNVTQQLRQQCHP